MLASWMPQSQQGHKTDRVGPEHSCWSGLCEPQLVCTALRSDRHIQQDQQNYSICCFCLHDFMLQNKKNKQIRTENVVLAIRFDKTRLWIQSVPRCSRHRWEAVPAWSFPERLEKLLQTRVDCAESINHDGSTKLQI